MKNTYPAELARRYQGPVLAAAAGAAIGFLAWGEGRTPILAAILPVAVGISSSRTRALALSVGYVLGTMRGLPAFAAAWFDNSLIVGTMLWLLVGLIAGAAWSLAWTASEVPWRKALAVAIAWVVTLLPPVAASSPGHAVLAWGYITPGWGWIGVALSILVPAAVMAVVTANRWSMAYVRGATVCLAGALAVVSHFHEEIENRYVNDMVAVSTRWGAASDPFEMLDRVERMGKTTRALSEENVASVVVFPESIVQTYHPTLYPILKEIILDDASKAGQTVVIGADLPTADGNFQTAALAFYPDGSSVTALTRQPVPIALWKPWNETGSFLTNWRGSNILPFRSGIKARVIFCFEEYMPILSLLNEAFDDHQMVIVLANTWASRSTETAAIQSRHSEGMAVLFGKRLIKAENRPKVVKGEPERR